MVGSIESHDRRTVGGRWTANGACRMREEDLRECLAKTHGQKVRIAATDRGEMTPTGGFP